MTVCRTVADLRLPWGDPIGFVPTMGAFHEGHLDLMKTAKRATGCCVVSLFVNPTQFGPKEDYAKYPRDERRDFELAEAVGVDVVFAPDVTEMYPGADVTVSVGNVTRRWEGEARPGHFEGVSTIVAKLFNIVRPTDAYFGLKDFQQCAVVSSLIAGLRFPIRLHLAETVREPDGLAMSSRNAMLSQAERLIAPRLYATLIECSRRIASGVDIAAAIADGRVALSASGFDVQYLACVDAVTLEPVDFYIAGSRLIAAAKLGSVRLIDNVSVA